MSIAIPEWRAVLIGSLMAAGLTLSSQVMAALAANKAAGLASETHATLEKFQTDTRATEQTAQSMTTALSQKPLVMAATEGMERRQDRRDDRSDNRGDRRDTRQDCRDEEGVAGKDKRDCKQEQRQDRRNGEDD